MFTGCIERSVPLSTVLPDKAVALPQVGPPVTQLARLTVRKMCGSRLVGRAYLIWTNQLWEFLLKGAVNGAQPLLVVFSVGCVKQTSPAGITSLQTNAALILQAAVLSVTVAVTHFWLLRVTPATSRFSQRCQTLNLGMLAAKATVPDKASCDDTSIKSKGAHGRAQHSSSAESGRGATSLRHSMGPPRQNSTKYM